MATRATTVTQEETEGAGGGWSGLKKPTTENEDLSDLQRLVPPVYLRTDLPAMAVHHYHGEGRSIICSSWYPQYTCEYIFLSMDRWWRRSVRMGGKDDYFTPDISPFSTSPTPRVPCRILSTLPIYSFSVHDPFRFWKWQIFKMSDIAACMRFW